MTRQRPGPVGSTRNRQLAVAERTEESVSTLPAPAPAPPRPERPAAEIARYVVGEAVWTPSVHNTQPWWFSVDSTGLCLYADPARQLAVADPAGREMLISCGAALFTARLALR